MSALDPTFDVTFVPRSQLPHLPTDSDPAGNLGVQVPGPFPLGVVHTDPKVAITVLSMLDEPVEAIGCYTPHAELDWLPLVRVGADEKRSPTGEKEKEGDAGHGWIDPAGYPDLVSVGSWVAGPADMTPGIRRASIVLHLRCTTSAVDILVGGLVSERIFSMGNENPYNIALYEPGALAATEAVYDDFLQNHVDNGAGTFDDRDGHSTTQAVHYLARTPQGRKEWWWRILVFLGPRPITTMWDEPPPTGLEKLLRGWVHENLDVEDGVQRLLAVTTSLTPSDEEQSAMATRLADYGEATKLLIWMSYKGRIKATTGTAPDPSITS